MSFANAKTAKDEVQYIIDPYFASYFANSLCGKPQLFANQLQRIMRLEALKAGERFH
jgi:hypothetical protein